MNHWGGVKGVGGGGGGWGGGAGGAWDSLSAMVVRAGGPITTVPSHEVVTWTFPNFTTGTTCINLNQPHTQKEKINKSTWMCPPVITSAQSPPVVT